MDTMSGAVSLLSRFANNAFWMARYMERAENLARLLDVNETFARDSQGVQDWFPIVQLHVDEEPFFGLYQQADAASVLEFYILERRNPNAIVSAVALARENARSLRHLISTELWLHLNMFHNRLAAMRPADLMLETVSALCRTVKEDCQLHAGIAAGTLYRDQVWRFYQIGKFIERADQTTRLLDIKYHRLAPAGEATTAVDIGQWNALLRSAAGYQAFRRVHPTGMRRDNVIRFFLYDRAFARSVGRCVDEVGQHLHALPRAERAGEVAQAFGAVRALVRLDEGHSPVAEDALHRHIDDIQLGLIALSDALGRAFLGVRPEAG
jgi:uncharacterized alpha-E superfamily protein